MTTVFFLLRGRIIEAQFQQCESRDGLGKTTVPGPRNYNHTECSPLLEFVKAMEPPDHVTLTVQPPPQYSGLDSEALHQFDAPVYLQLWGFSSPRDGFMCHLASAQTGTAAVSHSGLR